MLYYRIKYIEVKYANVDSIIYFALAELSAHRKKKLILRNFSIRNENFVFLSLKSRSINKIHVIYKDNYAWR